MTTVQSAGPNFSILKLHLQLHATCLRMTKDERLKENIRDMMKGLTYELSIIHLYWSQYQCRQCITRITSSMAKLRTPAIKNTVANRATQRPYKCLDPYWQVSVCAGAYSCLANLRLRYEYNDDNVSITECIRE